MKRHMQTTPTRELEQMSWIAMLMAICLIVTGVGSTARPAEEEPSDREVTYAIETALEVDWGVSPHLIDVTVEDGVVTLSGTVSNLLEQDRAVAVTARVKGVRSIIDQLDVRTVERSDDEIRSDAVRALADDPATDSYEIEVEVNGGIVTLDGTCPSWAGKLLAADVAKGVRGVRKVHNRVTYSYEWDRSDQDIQADIEGRLKMDPYVNEDLIDVTVNDGVVTLRGTVGSLAEKNYAVAKAHAAGTTRILDSDLTVSPWVQGPMQRARKQALVTDAEARQAVREALQHDPRVEHEGIEVEVDNGEATLRGIVDNLKARRAAGQDAENTRGIRKVNNQIRVRPPDDLTDTAIAENVRAALSRDTVVERSDISVLVRNRRVSLIGYVDTRYEKTRAEDVASRVKGVADVDNRLAVEQPWLHTSDPEIQSAVERRFFWNPFLDSDDLEVRVDDGHVEIVGRVGTWHEYRRAVKNAFDGGARSVRSYLWVESNGEMYDRRWSESPDVWPL